MMTFRWWTNAVTRNGQLTNYFGGSTYQGGRVIVDVAQGRPAHQFKQG